MKIDTDLRLTIRSAEKAQPSDDWQAQARQQHEAIADLFKRKPALAKRAEHLRASADAHEKAASAAREALCKEFGLQRNDSYDPKFQFSRCGDGRDQFVKKGGVIPAKFTRWKFDDVIAELAKADGKQAAAILKKYGINWK